MNSSNRPTDHHKALNAQAYRLLARTCLSFLGFCFLAVPTLGQTIANPSFETPNLSPGIIQSSPTGASWQFNQGINSFYSSGIVAYDASDSNDFQPLAPPPDGNQFGYMRSDASIQQTVSGFTVGQAYRLDWLQGYGGTLASGGSAILVELQASGGGPSQQIAPLELANSPSLTARSSDVFIATSETYELVVQSSDQVPFGYAYRNALVDQFSFVPVNEPPTTRTTYSASLALTAASGLQVDALLGGVPLGAGIESAVTGSIDLEFDIVNGTDVASLRFNPSEILLDPTLSEFIDGGTLGTADITLSDSGGTLFHTNSDPFGKHKVAVDSGGDFLLGSTFLGFDGLAEIELEGPLVDLLGEDTLSIDLDSIPAADLGITYLGNQTLFADPGNIQLSPTGNPNEYLVTLDIPVLGITPIDSGIGLEVQLSGYLQAQGIVVVPEPSGLALAVLGGMTLIAARYRRRRA